MLLKCSYAMRHSSVLASKDIKLKISDSSKQVEVTPMYRSCHWFIKEGEMLRFLSKDLSYCHWADNYLKFVAILENNVFFFTAKSVWRFHGIDTNISIVSIKFPWFLKISLLHSAWFDLIKNGSIK